MDLWAFQAKKGNLGDMEIKIYSNGIKKLKP